MSNVWDDVPDWADPDVAEHPDSWKVGIWIDERGRFFRSADAVEHAGPD